MGDNRGESSNASDFYLMTVIFVLLVAARGDRIARWVRYWVSPLSHRLFISSVSGLLVAILVQWVSERRRDQKRKQEAEKRVIAPDVGAVYAGQSAEGEQVYIKPAQRAMHTQVIGTTNAGKTESVILPWAIQDIEQGRGLILIDGKADRGLLVARH
jgi:hypothetical protein